jgi:hypothetical protein
MRTPGMSIREYEHKPQGTTSWRDLEEQEVWRGEKGRCTVQLLTGDFGTAGRPHAMWPANSDRTRHNGAALLVRALKEQSRNSNQLQ